MSPEFHQLSVLLYFIKHSQIYLFSLLKISSFRGGKPPCLLDHHTSLIQRNRGQGYTAFLMHLLTEKFLVPIEFQPHLCIWSTRQWTCLQQPIV